jgi:hypothetical protein
MKNGRNSGNLCSAIYYSLSIAQFGAKMLWNSVGAYVAARSKEIDMEILRKMNEKKEDQKLLVAR